MHANSDHLARLHLSFVLFENNTCSTSQRWTQSQCLSRRKRRKLGSLTRPFSPQWAAHANEDPCWLQKVCLPSHFRRASSHIHKANSLRRLRDHLCFYLHNSDILCFRLSTSVNLIAKVVLSGLQVHTAVLFPSLQELVAVRSTSASVLARWKQVAPSRKPSSLRRKGRTEGIYMKARASHGDPGRILLICPAARSHIVFGVVGKRLATTWYSNLRVLGLTICSLLLTRIVMRFFSIMPACQSSDRPCQ